ncbi:hypothetical protein [Pseudomonas gingeri]|uniref:Uncharacterized protein n=1 Tax=Pseudomonas gingeri TaxID=117681 RepID=A0A7Y8CIV6_9PSED|nr:hypothetical protein [Pseudomonas gingeri]NWA02525.1 hypothetical protein [Pseudomonas gingeri]NWA12302.1 hypothetical protein [Pseudomonas gingeri]NWA57292.1 hypothetical protein [Pseudomonas gingeri]NWA93635.1 hypothetical protein [Pseudomonas gingeri]NWB03107.1 hypothetical protein [Pseudomonas gingeri]
MAFPVIAGGFTLAPVANVAYDASCPADLVQIAPYVMSAFSPLMQRNFSTITLYAINPVAAGEEECHGYTAMQPQGVQIAITRITDNVSSVEKQGRYANTLAHEVFLHAANFLYNGKYGGSVAPLSSEDAAHKRIFYPADQHNDYLNVMRHVLGYLPPGQALRRAFLAEYARDVDINILHHCDDESHTEIAYQWQAQLEGAASNPNDPLWAPRGGPGDLIASASTDFMKNLIGLS